MATLQEIAEYWPNASPQWRADVISILGASDEGKQQLRWLQQYQGATEEDRARRAAEPPSTMDQVATNLGAPLLAGFGSAGGIAAGNALFGAGSGAAGGAAGAGAAAAPAAAAAGAPAIAGAGGATAAAAPTVAGTGAAAGASGGAAAGGGTAAAAPASEGLLGMGALPIAAIGAGLYAGARGLNSARRQWQEGHGQQQSAAMNVANPMVGGLNSMLGHPVSNEDTGYMALMANPLTTAVGVPLAGYHYLGHNLLGLPDVPNFWSGKSKDQLGRDQVKNRFQESGLADQDYKLNINGQTYDLAKPTDPEGRHYYDINFDAEGSGNQASQLSALASALGITQNKQNSDAAGMLYNAINSGGDTNENMRSLIEQAGGHDALYTSLAQQRDAGLISKEDADIGFNALDQAAGVGAYAPGGKAYVDPKKKGLLGLGAVTSGRP